MGPDTGLVGAGYACDVDVGDVPDEPPEVEVGTGVAEGEVVPSVPGIAETGSKKLGC